MFRESRVGLLRCSRHSNHAAFKNATLRPIAESPACRRPVSRAINSDLEYDADPPGIQPGHESIEGLRMAVVKPANEEARIVALDKYAILDTDPEQSFDDLTLLASF